jgi:predicted PurR-regulated permease PerM
MERKKITFDSFIRGIIVCIIIVALLALIDRLSGVLLPFFIAWIIAYLIYPLVKLFQFKLHVRSRVLSIMLAFITILAIGGGLAYLFIPPMVEEMTRVHQLLITYITDGFGNQSHIPHSLSQFIRENIDQNALNKYFSEENLTNLMKNALPKLWNLLTESISIVFSILASLIILLYVVFILLDYESIADGWVHLLPVKYRKFTTTLIGDLQTAMNRYFRGQAFVALCVGILFSIGFSIIDFPLAIGLGLFIGALNMVPYLQVVGFIPAILLAILKSAETGQNFWIIMASVVVVFAVVQLIQDSFIVPKVMGKITGLNPAIILLSLSVWGSLMGVLGMIIALPMTTLLLSYYQRFIINKEPINSLNQAEDDTEQAENSTCQAEDSTEQNDTGKATAKENTAAEEGK